MRSLLWLACILHVQAFQIPNAVPKLNIRGRATPPVARSGPLGLFVQPSEGAKPKGTYNLMASQVNTSAESRFESGYWRLYSETEGIESWLCEAGHGPLCPRCSEGRVQTLDCPRAGELCAEPCCVIHSSVENYPYPGRDFIRFEFHLQARVENAYRQKEEAKNEFLAFETASSDKIAQLQSQTEQSSWSRFPFTSSKIEEEAQKVRAQNKNVGIACLIGLDVHVVCLLRASCSIPVVSHTKYAAPFCRCHGHEISGLEL
jgi:hypothetical protein